MRKLFLKSTLFIFPFILYCSFIVLVDPFNFFSTVPSIVPTQVKESSSRTFNEALWRLIEYRDIDANNLLIGDSRMMNLDIDLIEEISGEEFYNLGYGGATLRDLISTFWYAVDESDFDHVYFGIAFDDYNKFDQRDNISHLTQMMENPLLYIFNRSVFRVAILNFRDMRRKEYTIQGVPEFSKEEFWQQQLEYARVHRFGRYQYPKGYYTELKKIADYCAENNIELQFIIFPSHIDVHQVIIDNNLLADEIRFKQDLDDLAQLIDFDAMDSLWIKNKKNFRDPFHANIETLTILTQEIWGHN